MALCLFSLQYKGSKVSCICHLGRWKYRNLLDKGTTVQHSFQPENTCIYSEKPSYRPPGDNFEGHSHGLWEIINRRAGWGKKENTFVQLMFVYFSHDNPGQYFFTRGRKMCLSSLECTTPIITSGHTTSPVKWSLQVGTAGQAWHAPGCSSLRQLFLYF